MVVDEARRSFDFILQAMGSCEPLMIFLNIYLFILRERESGARAEREGERESQVGSIVSTEPDMELDPTTVVRS